MTLLPLTRDLRPARTAARPAATPAPTPVVRRPATPEEVADAELRGSWVVDARRRREAARGGWLVQAEDDIVFLTDHPDADPDWPPVWGDDRTSQPDGAA